VTSRYIIHVLMKMSLAILLPIIVVIIVASVVAIVLTANVDHNGKVRKGCCGNTNEETEDSSHVEADLEDEVIFGEIRYPKENPLGKKSASDCLCMANHVKIIHQVSKWSIVFPLVVKYFRTHYTVLLNQMEN